SMEDPLLFSNFKLPYFVVQETDIFVDSIDFQSSTAVIDIFDFKKDFRYKITVSDSGDDQYDANINTRRRWTEPTTIVVKLRQRYHPFVAEFPMNGKSEIEFIDLKHSSTSFKFPVEEHIWKYCEIGLSFDNTLIWIFHTVKQSVDIFDRTGSKLSTISNIPQLRN